MEGKMELVLAEKEERVSKRRPEIDALFKGIDYETT